MASVSLSRASPKSVSLTVSVWVRSTFRGLMSRWTTPTVWAASSPKSVWRRSGHSVSHGIGPPAIRSWRLPPSTYSITMNSPRSVSRSAITRTMWGLATRAIARASVRKRRTNAASVAIPAEIDLSATGIPRAVSSARYTTPIPPRPSTRWMWYSPTRTPTSGSVGDVWGGASLMRGIRG